MAERIIAKLRRKMARFALMVARETPGPGDGTGRDVVQETFEALLRLGHSAADAHKLVDSVTSAKKKFKSTDEMLVEIYQRGK